MYFSPHIMFIFALSSCLLLAVAMAKAEPSYYDILGVTRNAKPDEIKQAYRAKAKQFHPDKNKDLDPDTAQAKFIEVSKAYEVLSDASSKREYDENVAFGNANGMKTQQSRNHPFHHQPQHFDFEHWEDFHRQFEEQDEVVYVRTPQGGFYFKYSASSQNAHFPQHPMMPMWLKVIIFVFQGLWWLGTPTFTLLFILLCVRCCLVPRVHDGARNRRAN